MRHLSKEIDALLKDGSYSVYNLPNRPYKPNEVEHWLRYHFPVLLAAHEGETGDPLDSDLHIIYIDLMGAIWKLPHRERQAIDLLLEGWPPYGKRGIARKMGLKDWELKQLLSNAYKFISEDLG
jgi:hypothetical protein